MKVSTIALTMMTLFGSSVALAASPNVQGGTSDTTGTLVAVDQPSNHILFGGGNSGLKLNNNSYGYIDIAGGPVKGSNDAIAAGPDSSGNYYLTPNIINPLLPNSPNIAQVWRASASNGAANFVINSVRQINVLPLLPFAPEFGGLVVGQVANSSGAPLAVGSGVYFGEWAPKVASAAASGADLNQTSANRTVWYVGDNAVSSTPNLDNVKYNVIGINQTGTNASGTTLAGGLPDSPNLYKGQLTANYSTATSTGSITGILARSGSSNIDFAGTVIGNTGTFANTDPTKNIEGRFYNGAEALAGIYKGSTSTAADDVAFGGSKVSGTITP